MPKLTGDIPTDLQTVSDALDALAAKVDALPQGASVPAELTATVADHAAVLDHWFGKEIAEVRAQREADAAKAASNEAPATGT